MPAKRKPLEPPPPIPGIVQPLDPRVLEPADNHPRMCKTCRQMLPAAAFPSLRNTECKGCLKTRTLAVKKQAWEEQAAADMELLLIRTDAGGQGMPQIEDLLKKVVASYGGMDQFVLYYKRQLDRVAEAKPTVGLLNHFAKLFALIDSVNGRKEAQNISEMSLEEIKREQTLMLIQQLKEIAENKTNNDMFRELLKAQGTSLDDLLGQPEVVERLTADHEPVDLSPFGGAGDAA